MKKENEKNGKKTVKNIKKWRNEQIRIFWKKKKNWRKKEEKKEKGYSQKGTYTPRWAQKLIFYIIVKRNCNEIKAQKKIRFWAPNKEKKRKWRKMKENERNEQLKKWKNEKGWKNEKWKNEKMKRWKKWKLKNWKMQKWKPREEVLQDGPVHAAEQVVSGDQRVQMEREPQQQHASVPEPSAQPSSSRYEEPMQVSTTPRRARNPDDENETRTVRPRLEMSALIKWVVWARCSWNWLGDACYGQQLGVWHLHWTETGEEQVRAGRETEVKRMLEFEVY